MIAVSDAVLILVSAAILFSGLYRWQNNIEQANQLNSRPVMTNAAGVQNNVAASETAQNGDANRQISSTNGAAVNTPVSVETQINASSDDVPAEASTANTGRTAESVVIAEPAPTSTINVADDNATTAVNNSVADVPPLGTYVVRQGDSLSRIADIYGTTVSTLQIINDIEGSLITVGQRIRYPLPVN